MGSSKTSPIIACCTKRRAASVSAYARSYQLVHRIITLLPLLTVRGANSTLQNLLAQMHSLVIRVTATGSLKIPVKDAN